MSNYRNPYLLRLAAKAPHCFSCQRANVGQVVAAHSNHHADGKGMGLKASDAMVAFLCDDCHSSIDQGSASRELKRAAWVEAYMATMRWLVESGHFIVSPVPTPPPVIEARPKRKIAKSKPIQSRGFGQVTRKFDGSISPTKRSARKVQMADE